MIVTMFRILHDACSSNLTPYSNPTPTRTIVVCRNGPFYSLSLQLQ